MSVVVYSDLHYWVRIEGVPGETVARFDGNEWWLAGDDRGIPDNKVTVVAEVPFPLEKQPEHAEGHAMSVNWKPGGARGNIHQLFADGEQYLFAVQLSSGAWDFAVVDAHCDPETGTFFTANGEVWGDWTWADVEWFVPCRHFVQPTEPTP